MLGSDSKKTVESLGQDKTQPVLEPKGEPGTDGDVVPENGASQPKCLPLQRLLLSSQELVKKDEENDATECV